MEMEWEMEMEVCEEANEGEGAQEDAEAAAQQEVTTGVKRKESETRDYWDSYFDPRPNRKNLVIDSEAAEAVMLAAEADGYYNLDDEDKYLYQLPDHYTDPNSMELGSGENPSSNLDQLTTPSQPPPQGRGPMKRAVRRYSNLEVDSEFTGNQFGVRPSPALDSIGIGQLHGLNFYSLSSSEEST